MRIYQPIFTRKNISKALREEYIHTLQDGRKILWWFFLFVEIEPFSTFCDHQEIEYESREIEIGVAGPILTQNNQILYGTMSYILYKIVKIIVAILHIYGARAIFLLFWYHREIESESQEMKICVAGLIFVQKYQRLYGTMIYIPHRMGEK